ncbi:MAG: YraN family protein [Xanthomonadales bacterium]|nr:YraN family protein [Gammaproteobacteria bacterium]MBT8052599.1 YraN family protein [Gammaproteobacteria bacterium]NND56642.1 YraN family protein [Xanthomonadales bacterium]NNK52416.1 YraN family protein [Xanthomonadales bacterium]
MTARQRGDYWEKIAESFLNCRGLKTIERNYLSRFGEIDLVMLDGETVVFAEVRYRANTRHGSGADSVTHAKQRRIISAARRFIQCHPETSTRPCRFDVLSIGVENGDTRVNWIQDAFNTG